MVDTSPVDFGKLRAMVESGNPEWTVTEIGGQDAVRGNQMTLVEPLDAAIIDRSGYPASAIDSHVYVSSAYSTALGCRTDSFPGGNQPKGWTQFWDVKRFPGRLQLIGEWYGVAVAHTVLALSFVVILTSAGLRTFDQAQEQAAAGVGASWFTAVWRITLPQLRPSLGVTPKGLHYGMGCNGSGVAMLCYLGAEVGKKLLGGTNRLPVFDGRDFPTRAFYTGTPWMLPIVGNWYRFRDWLDRRAA